MFLKLLTLFILTKNVLALGPELTIPSGKLEGHYKKTENGNVYSAFEGIPYARPPVGKYRFEESKPMKPWFGTWQAKTLSTCMQYYHYTKPVDDYVLGDEDCLHVNVYTPNHKDGKFRDVIVFIHGGAFMFNSGASYGEKYLMDFDVVYVTFNYRLGPLGFISTEDRNVPGNMGLKDQLLALRWIKENIRNFGGNPDSILLTGMSAGGASVHIHTLSPRTQDVQLFHKAIAQSGTSLNPWVLVENACEKTIKLGSLVGCPAYDIKEMVKCMKYRPAKQIVAAVGHFQPYLYNPFSPFGVVVDKWSDNPILPQHPYQMLKNKAQILNIPIIFSSVQAEGLYPGAEFDSHIEEIDSRWNDVLPFILDYNNTINSGDIDSVNNKVKKFYLDDQKLSMKNFASFIQSISDRMFLVDIEKATRLHSSINSESTFSYYYNYRAKTSLSDRKTINKADYGVCHGDDTIMVLSHPVVTSRTGEDKTMANIMQNLWLSFAKTGIPKVQNVNWETVSRVPEEPFKYLEINSPSNIKMATAEYLGNRVNFWDTLPIKENEKLITSHDEL